MIKIKEGGRERRRRRKKENVDGVKIVYTIIHNKQHA